MTTQQIASILTYVIIGLFILAFVFLTLALQQLRRGRRGPYWRLRRQASQRGSVLLLTSLGLFVVSFALAFYSGLAALAFRGLDDIFQQSRRQFIGVFIPTETPTLMVTTTMTPSSTVTATNTPTATATSTDQPTVTMTTTSTATPTLTLTPTITASPSATATVTATIDSVLQLTPPAVGRPARASAVLRLDAIAADLSEKPPPANAEITLPAGLKRIYLFMSFENMSPGVTWSRVLYRNGHPIQGQAYLWGQGEAGESFFLFGNVDGYPPGSYEVRLFIGPREASSLQFSIAA